MTCLIKVQVLFSKKAMIVKAIRGGKRKKKKNGYYAFKLRKGGKTSDEVC